MDTLEDTQERGQQGERKLAAIMFTDMVGYSSLSQGNEALALKLLDRHQKIVRSILPKYSGREIETAGDSFFIEFQSQIIGGIMCPIFDKKAIYEWYICGIDGKFKGIFPSVLATWAAINYANLANIHFFDFMGAGKPDKAYGVRDFKSKFGGHLVNYGRYEKVHKPALMQIGKFSLKLWKRTI